MVRRARKRFAKYGTCPMYWGSHGCNKPNGHLGKHRCQCGGYLTTNGFTYPDGYAPSLHLAGPIRTVRDPKEGE